MSFDVLVSEGEEENEKRQRLARTKQQEAQGEQVRLALRTPGRRLAVSGWLLMSNSHGVKSQAPSCLRQGLIV